MVDIMYQSIFLASWRQFLTHALNLNSFLLFECRSDIKNSSDFRLTKYVLLGTLFSFAIAIVNRLLLPLWNDNVVSLWIWNNFTNIKFTNIKFRTSWVMILSTSGRVIPKTNYLKDLIESLFYGNYLRKTSCLLSRVLYNVLYHYILLASNET